MVREVNRTEVDPSDRLSDQVCYYSCNQKQLIYAQSGRELQEALDIPDPKEQKSDKEKTVGYPDDWSVVSIWTNCCRKCGKTYKY